MYLQIAPTHLSLIRDQGYKTLYSGLELRTQFRFQSLTLIIDNLRQNTLLTVAHAVTINIFSIIIL